ncbi:hypothetical protein P7K49_016180 [Saguinus oedipus]|uniref:Uncharacterized protein n=1 Tax=Saguinus oedipus TaxID=9490 RepID=A0ABQ9VBM0_SAGOE|nr:hypothetical protein P7K49_016180 [Saguinus oedipus]
MARGLQCLPDAPRSLRLRRPSRWAEGRTADWRARERGSGGRGQEARGAAASTERPGGQGALETTRIGSSAEEGRQSEWSGGPERLSKRGRLE